MAKAGSEARTEDLGKIADVLRFVWWNTSLSPPGTASRTTPVQMDFVVDQLLKTRIACGWDVLGLCEVNSNDVATILKGLGDPALSAVTMTPAPGPVNDTAIIFDREKLNLIGEMSLRDMHGTRSLKAGHLAEFESVVNGEVLHVVVSHWPGRMYMPEAAYARFQLGMSLQRSLGEILKRAGNIIVMGDFNDDPSSPSLAHNLFATRDRTLASEKKHLMYNPFWRRIGESEPFGSALGICGTHYYAGGTDSRWYTYDQILFSRSFLGIGHFVLDENASQIIALPDLTAEIMNRESIYDHYPVTSAILLREKT